MKRALTVVPVCLIAALAISIAGNTISSEAKEQHIFSINDASIVFVDPKLPNFYKAPIRIAQDPKISPYLYMVDEGGKPYGIASVPKRDWEKKIYGSISGPLIFVHGAKHIMIGEISFGGYVFKSDHNHPLVFQCDKDKGYIYVQGKGTIILPNKKSILLTPQTKK